MVRTTPSTTPYDLIAFLEGVVGEPAVLVGHSLGGLVSAETIMRRPELVTRALLEDPPMFVAGDGGSGSTHHRTPSSFR